MPAKFTFLIDGDSCSEDTFASILKVCAEQLLGCNRIIVFRGEQEFPLTLADTTKPYRDLLDKIFFSDIPQELHDDSANFVSYSIGHANAHTGNMRDHLSDIMTQSIPFMAGTKDKKQHFVFVSSRVHKKHMPADTFRIKRPEDLMILAESDINKSGGGGTGMESIMSMMPNASRFTSFVSAAGGKPSPL